MSENEFISKLESIGIKLSDVQIEKFRKYLNFLLEYNEHCNLTAIKTFEEVYLKHFYDSLLLLKFKTLGDETVLDIGSGAGFPGVPLKIVCPNINLTCLDSNGKKTKFLELLKSELSIDFEVVNTRAEEYIIDNREKFDYVVSRAVSNMPVLCELTIPFVKIGGEVIAYKGVGDEDSGEFAISVLGGEIKDIFIDQLPKENSMRRFICIQKKCKTDMEYPRRYDKILKKPLQNLKK